MNLFRSGTPRKITTILLLACCFSRGQAQTAGPASGYATAESLLREHRWEEGAAALAPLLKQSPNDPKVLNLAGLAFSGKGDRAQGSAYFEKALRVDPAFVPALKNLAVNELGTGQIDAAERHLRKAEQEAPLDPLVQLYLGEISFEKQAFPAAIAHLEHAGDMPLHDPKVAASLAISYLKAGKSESRPRVSALLDTLQPSALSPRFQVALGAALAESGQPMPAIALFEAAHRSAPENEDLNYDLALCYLAANKPAEAVAALRRSIDRGRETADSDNLLSEAYEKSGQTQAAVDSLRRAIALNPEDDENYLDFASLCIDHQDFKNADKVLGIALATHPRSARLIFERGILNAMQDHFEEAEKDFERSAELAPQENSGYVALGVTYLETGDSTRAIQILRKRVQERANDARLLALLGEALLRSGAQPGQPDFAEAQTVTEKSIRLDASLCEPHTSLGTIYLKQGRLEDAVEQLENARRIDPKAKSAYSHLAVAYRRLGQTDKSQQMLVLLQSIHDQERGDARQKLKGEGLGGKGSSKAEEPR